MITVVGIFEEKVRADASDIFDELLYDHRHFFLKILYININGKLYQQEITKQDKKAFSYITLAILLSKE